MRLFATIALFGVLATACGSAGPTSTVPPEGSSPNRAAIYAVALHQLVSVDNTFGGDGNPWSELLVLASLDPSAGDATFGGGAPDPQQVRPLTAEERNAIEAALSPLEAGAGGVAERVVEVEEYCADFSHSSARHEP